MTETTTSQKLDNIPAELKAEASWVCWKYEERDGRLTKNLRQTNGRQAASNDPSTWTTFEEAVEALRRGSFFDGIGFVFHEGNPYAGVDLDKMSDEEARPWLEEFDSYAERSPSGNGLHIICKAELIQGTKRDAGELYSSGRFFTMTGDMVHAAPIREAQDTAERFYASLRAGDPPASARCLSSTTTPPMTDAEIVSLAQNAKNGERFAAVYAGGGDFDSSSERDMSLARLVAFFTQDPEQIERIMRGSGCVREKWDKHRTYLRDTISKAIEWCQETYTGDDGATLSPNGNEARASQAIEGVEPEKPSGAKKRNQADRLIDYALDSGAELFVDQVGAPHARVGAEAVPLNTRANRWLRGLIWEAENASVSSEALRTVTGTLAAFAVAGGRVRELHTRAAFHDGAIFYQLGPGRVARIGTSGYALDPDPPVLFRSIPNLKPLPDPEPGGTLDALDGLVNLKQERDARMFKAYALTIPLPQIPRPILQTTGVMGSGKTTAGRIIKRLLDPSAPETVRVDPRDFLQKVSHCYIAMLDNQNSLPEWAVDTICRLVTGEADSKRSLYTDDEDFIYEMRRAIILNGINPPTERGDAQDRTLPIELDRIPDRKRRSEQDLWADFEAEHGRLLGAIFDALSKTLKEKETLRLGRRPRLADWGEYAAAAYRVLGWGEGLFLEDWGEVVKVQNQGTLDGSPIAQAIVGFMEDRDEWRGNASELHKELELTADELGIDTKREKQWPKSTTWLWRRVREVLPTLTACGVEADQQHNETGSVITLLKNGEGPEPDPDSTKSDAVRNAVRTEAAYLSDADSTDSTDSKHGSLLRTQNESVFEDETAENDAETDRGKELPGNAVSAVSLPKRDNDDDFFEE